MNRIEFTRLPLVPGLPLFRGAHFPPPRHPLALRWLHMPSQPHPSQTHNSQTPDSDDALTKKLVDGAAERLRGDVGPLGRSLGVALVPKE